MKAIFDNKCRIIFSVLLSATLILIVMLVDSVSRHNRNVAELEEYISHEDWKKNNKPLDLDNLPIKDNRTANEDDEILGGGQSKINDELRNPPPTVYSLKHYLINNISNMGIEVVLFFAELVIYIYLLLYCMFLYKKEDHVGWKRLSLVLSSIISVASFAIIIASGEDRVSFDKMVAYFFAGLIFFHLSLMMMLGGKRIYRWISEGFNE